MSLTGGTRASNPTRLDCRVPVEGDREWIEHQWSRRTSGQGLSPAVIDAETSEAVRLAHLGLREPEGHCEIGYWVVPSARGRGIGTQSVRLSSRWVLSETEMYRLFAHIVPGNAASLATMDNRGLTREGCLPEGGCDSTRTPARIAHHIGQ